jgi:hypothetical protein
MEKLLKILIQSVIIVLIFARVNGLEPTEDNSMSSLPVYNVCNIDLIYDKANGFEYSLPKALLQSYLSGKAFDNKEVYSEEESSRVRDDINEIFQTILSSNPVKENLAVITAGAPGAGKTTKQRQDLEANKALGKPYAYICPDDVCLKGQARTYQKDIQKGDGSKESWLAAYNKWRPSSNAATHLILGNLIREKFAFYLGTTSTGPATGKFFEFLKKQGYQIRLIHVTAPDDVRWESIRERDKTFVQTTEQDVKEKGLLLPQRITDTFLAYADQIEFYYRDAVKNDALLAATWLRNSESGKASGTLRIKDSTRYEQIKSIHNAGVAILNRADLLWETTVEANSIVSQGSDKSSDEKEK